MFLFLKRIYSEVSEVRMAKYSAALAFYAIYALAPMVIIFVSIGGLTIGEGLVEERIIFYFQERLGDSVVPFFENMVSSIQESRAHILFSAVGLLFVFYGLSHFFSTLREAFFTIFGIEFGIAKNLPKTFNNFLRSAIYTFVLTILIFVLILINALAPIFLSFSDLWFIGFLSHIPFMNFLMTFVLTILILAFIYKFVSGFQISWARAFWGGTLAAVLFAFLNIILALYFSLFHSAHAIYGASASLIAFLLWVYYSTKILLAGALATRVFSKNLKN